MLALVREALALLVYPGFVLLAAAGLGGEVASGSLGHLREVARPRRRPAGAVALAAALGSVAAAQLTAPFSPADAVDRNLLVAVVATAGVVWLAWAWFLPEGGAGLLAGLAGWAVALLTPAVLVQDLHPQVAAVQGLSLSSPARLLAALLCLASTALLLEALAAAPALRLWLWLPAGGLFASTFVPAAGDDVGGLLRFFGAAIAFLAAAAALAAGARRLPRADRLVWALSALTFLGGVITTLR